MVVINFNAGHINIEISLDDMSLDGGVYMFLIDDVPLYIGETSVFLSRLASHLYELKKDAEYFGLSKLEREHNITYKILENGLPYLADVERKQRERLKRTPDKNRLERERLQNEYIGKFFPLTQNPIQCDNIRSETVKSRKKDSMINDGNIKCQIIKNYTENDSEICKYGKIKEDLKKHFKDKGLL